MLHDIWCTIFRAPQKDVWWMILLVMNLTIICIKFSLVITQSFQPPFYTKRYFSMKQFL